MAVRLLSTPSALLVAAAVLEVLYSALRVMQAVLEVEV
jgi:hypothetical protein